MDPSDETSSDEEAARPENLRAILRSIGRIAEQAAECELTEAVPSHNTPGRALCSLIAAQLFELTHTETLTALNRLSRTKLLRAFIKLLGEDLSKLVRGSDYDLDVQQRVEETFSSIAQDDAELLPKAGRVYKRARRAARHNQDAPFTPLQQGSLLVVALTACHEELRTLYDMLLKFAVCSIHEDSTHEIRLKLYHGWLCGNFVKIDMVLSGNNEHEQAKPSWYDIGVSIGRHIVHHSLAGQAIAYHDTTEFSRTGMRFEELEPPLCRKLSPDGRMLISVPQGRSRNAYISSGAIDKQQFQATHIESMTLARLLGSHSIPLEQHHKVAMAYSIASAIWQSYTAEWISSSIWTSETVYFMYTPGSSDVHASTPYLAVVPSTEGNVPEQVDPRRVSHSWTRILSLGVMLMEIASGKPFLSKDTQSVRRLNTMHEWARSQLLHRDTWKRFPFSHYRHAASKCLDPRLFDKAATLTQRQSILYNNVISPLHQLMCLVGWRDNLGSSDHITIEGSPKSLTNIFQSFPISRSLSPAEEWLRRADQIRESLDLESRHRTKIAILDTGYDDSTSFFQPKARYERIIKWKDLAEPSNMVPKDLDGHGTSMLSLIMRMVPDADLYVIRVAKDSADLAGKSSRIVEGLRFAQLHGVQIISLSFGFREQSKALNQAIGLCLNEGIVFFAAAANTGANEEELFPACHPQVISIRSTDHKGHFQDTNPSEVASTSAFGTLGARVGCQGLDLEPVIKDGASVATAIAAGMAGLLMQYAANSNDLRNNIHVQESLKTFQGITALFRALSREHINSTCRYRYVTLWALEDQPRAVIEAIISTAMRDVKQQTA